MVLKSLSFALLLVGLVACSPVRYKTTDSENCEDPTCSPTSPWPPDDGTAIWRAGAWGPCSPACEGGTQSREVSCVNKNNQLVPEERCKEFKPATSQACTADSCACTPADKTLSLTVPSGNNLVDILVVIDDSSSMTPDNAKLAQRLNGFVTDLQTINLDWQMCITTTDVSYYEGRPIRWSGTNSRVLTKSTPNLSTVFQQTMSDIGSGYSNDEQGIKASNLSILNNATYPCYRKEAAMAVILISDEDERSVGGNQSLSAQQYQPLGAQNYPTSLISTAKETFGAGKRLTVNSIVVPDNECKKLQDAQGTLSFIGTKYKELSGLTSGPIGNICDYDYSKNLQYFKDAILSTVSSVTLECAPTNNPVVTLPAEYTWTLVGNKITFNPALKPGATVSVKYQCCP